MPLRLDDPDVVAVVAAQRLCFAATVSPAGRPNLSPKGTIRIRDRDHLFFLDIASPRTVSNLRTNPWIEINIIDQLSRRGYRFLGQASIHRGDDVYEAAVAQIAREEGVRYEADTVVLVAVEDVRPVWSPGYDHIADEQGMRALWRPRRAGLDDEFERHVRAHGPFRPPRR